MRVQWRFTRFDYERYLEMRPILRAATTPEEFAPLITSPEEEAVVDALNDNEISPVEARQAFVELACCLGEPLPFEGGFLHLLTVLARRRGAEDAAELLTEMLAGGKNLEPWLLPAPGLVGLLTPNETALLQTAFAAMGRNAPLSGRGRRRRRGGLLARCGRFLRRLLDRGPGTDEMYRLLFDLVDEAARNGEGLAVIPT